MSALAIEPKNDVETFYATLDVEEQLIARHCANDIRRHAMAGARSLLDIGACLLLARDRLPEGTWLTWTAREFPQWSRRHIYNFIAIAERREFATRCNSRLSMRVLAYLCSRGVSDEARDEIAGLVEDGETFTLEEAQAAVAELSADVEELIAEVKAAAHRQALIDKIGRCLGRLRRLAEELELGSSSRRLIDRFEHLVRKE